jgi:hypothetical protein
MPRKQTYRICEDCFGKGFYVDRKREDRSDDEVIVEHNICQYCSGTGLRIRGIKKAVVGGDK